VQQCKRQRGGGCPSHHLALENLKIEGFCTKRAYITQKRDMYTLFAQNLSIFLVTRDAISAFEEHFVMKHFRLAGLKVLGVGRRGRTLQVHHL